MIKDVLTEMRNRSDTVIGGRAITMRNFVSQEKCEEWADRIEQSVTNHNQLKMREALEWFWSKRSMLDFCHNNLSDKTWEDWDKVYHFLREFADKVQSALSAPPRNCDVFANERGALDAIHNDRGCVQNPLDERKLTVHWLLADAKTEGEESETKGEFDENTIGE